LLKSILRTESNVLIHELHFQSLDIPLPMDEYTKFIKVMNEDMAALTKYFDDKDLYGGEGRSGENHPYMLTHYRALYEMAGSEQFTQ